MIKRLLIDKLANEPNGARDYYLNDEERATIVECIEKQIPKEAKCHIGGNGWYGWTVFTCPVCGKEFKDSLCCPCCYQRVKPQRESDD